MKIFLCTLRLRIKTYVVYWQRVLLGKIILFFVNVWNFSMVILKFVCYVIFFLFVCLHRSIYANMITYRTLIHKTSLNYKPNVRNLVCLRFEWKFCILEDLWLDLLNIFVLNLLIVSLDFISSEQLGCAYTSLCSLHFKFKNMYVCLLWLL